MAKMKTPTLEEVKEYFKDAELIADAYTEKEINLDDYDFNTIEFGKHAILKDDVIIYHKTDKDDDKFLYEVKKGYAKILSYKEPKEKTYKIKQETGMDSITINDVKYIKEDKDSYKITREQIFELCMPSLKTNRERLELIFPEVFETKLTVGKWYKFRSGALALYQGKNKESYGFHGSGKYFEKHFWFADYNSIGIEREATNQEVEEALIKEVKKRYKAGDYVEKIHRFSNKYITGNNPGIVVDSDYKVWYGGCIVFKDGQWAEIIPTLTKQEAEAKLNCKII